MGKTRDSLNPPLFVSFINDLGQQMNALNNGIMVQDGSLSLLVYADNIVCLAPDIKAAQEQMEVLSSWCVQWGMYLNVKKMQVVHIRHHQKSGNRTKLICRVGMLI